MTEIHRFFAVFIKFLVISQFTVLAVVEGLQYGLPRRAYVETENGPLIGGVALSRDGNQYFQFLGIPYGQVPERFGLSVSPVPWRNEPKEAIEFGPACIQINEFTGQVSGEEECLFLNVYTPDLPFRNNSVSLPVLFVIHSGGFSLGDAKNVDPSYLMDEGVVVVTANYRLGAFGFLNTGNAAARGNMGLKDLILALKWVSKEIANFGGDPERVVVEGSSSASFAASYLTISPMAKGLISGAISHSGSALCPWTRQFKPGMALANAKKLAVAVDCPSNNPTYLVKCLQRLDTRVILEATVPADSVLFNASYPQFGPSLETYMTDDDTFLNEEPFTLLARGAFNKIPYILGLTSNEGLLLNAAGVLSDEKLITRLNTEWGRVAPNTFIYEEYARDPCTVSAEISQFYFAKRNISRADSPQLSAAYGDRWFNKCTRDMAALYSIYAPVYMYNFTRTGSHSLVDHFDWYSAEDKNKPPSHADDMQYLFKSPNLFPEISSKSNTTSEPSSSDYNFSKKFVKMFTSFAETGRPECSLCSEQENGWVPALTSNAYRDDFNARPNFQWLRIDDTSKMEFEHADFISRMDFWDNLGLTDYNIVNVSGDVINPPPTSSPTMTPPSARIGLDFNSTDMTGITETTQAASYLPASSYPPQTVPTTQNCPCNTTTTTDNQITCLPCSSSLTEEITTFSATSPPTTAVTYSYSSSPTIYSTSSSSPSPPTTPNSPPTIATSPSTPTNQYFPPTTSPSPSTTTPPQFDTTPSPSIQSRSSPSSQITATPQNYTDVKVKTLAFQLNTTIFLSLMFPQHNNSMIQTSISNVPFTIQRQ